MKLLEYEAKQIFAKEGIQVPKGILVNRHEEILIPADALAGKVVVKAQVDIGGRGKAGGVLMADHETVIATARQLLDATIKGLPGPAGAHRGASRYPARVLREHHN